MAEVVKKFKKRKTFIPNNQVRIIRSKTTQNCKSRTKAYIRTNSDVETIEFQMMGSNFTIETFRKPIVFEKFGRKTKYGLCVVNYAKITLKLDQVENDCFIAFRNATKPNRS